MNFKTLAVAIMALLACQFALTGQAQALSLKSTAHCLGEIRDSSGNVVADLGTISAYTAFLPQDGSHQDQCVQDVFGAATAYFSDKGKMCHAFFESNAGTLTMFYKLGSLDWRDSGGATGASSYNYPAACFAPTGHVFPSYYIFTLVYAPPGCTPLPSPGYDCSAGNFVKYSSGSTMGTTTSIEKTTQFTADLSAKIEAISLGTGFSQISASGSDVTTTKSSTQTLTWPASGSVSDDGIYHDFDLFYLLINPSVAVSGWHDPVTGQNHAQWSLGTKNGASAKVQRVQVSYLRCALAGVGPRPGGTGSGGGNYDPTGSCTANPQLQMPGGGQQLNASATTGFLPGLDYDDYKQILAQDLFWNLAPNLAPNPKPSAQRFQKEPYDFPYDKPLGNGNACPSEEQEIGDEKTNTISTSTENDYKAKMALGGDMGIVSVDLSEDMTWTNKVTNSRTTTNSQTASATIGCASGNWTGNAQGLYYVGTYYDSLYGTFLFVLEDMNSFRLAQGHVADTDGDPIPHAPLKLAIGNQTYYTFSRNNGMFLFPSDTGQQVTGSGTLYAGGTGGTSQSVSIGPNVVTNVVLPTPPPVLSLSLSAAPLPPTPLGPVLNNPSLRTMTPQTGATPEGSQAFKTTAPPVSEASSVVSKEVSQAPMQASAAAQPGVVQHLQAPSRSATSAATLAGAAIGGAPAPAAPIYVAVKNRSLYARAKNVTVTAVQAITMSGTTLAYGGTLPFAVPDGTALRAGNSAIFAVPFATTPTEALRYLAVTVKADSMPAQTFVLINSTVPYTSDRKE